MQEKRFDRMRKMDEMDMFNDGSPDTTGIDVIDGEMATDANETAVMETVVADASGETSEMDSLAEGEDSGDISSEQAVGASVMAVGTTIGNPALVGAGCLFAVASQDGEINDTEDPDSEQDESPKKKAGFWTRKRIGLAAGVAAVLVVGAVGIGVAGATAPEAGQPASQAAKTAQAAGASKKTETAKTGGVAGTNAEAAGNAEAQPGADATQDAATQADAAVADAAQQAGQADAQGDAAASGNAGATAANGGSGSTGNKASGNTGSSSGSSNAGSSSSSSSSGNSSSSSSGGSSKPAAKPAHEHDWQPVTDKQWVPNMVTVTDKAAWDEPVYESVHECKCGETFSSNSEAAAHTEQYAIQGIGGHSSRVVKKQVDTIHHEAETHQEDQGHYETVTTGYKCSCGATK